MVKYPLKIQKFSSFFLIVLLAISCSTKKDKEESTFSTAEAIQLSGDVILDQELELSLENANTYRQIQWTILDEQGEATALCNSLSGSPIRCTFTTSGKHTIRVSALLNDGTITFEKIVDVLDPNARANQAPVLVLDVRVADQLKASVASNTSNTTGSFTFMEGIPVTFDFARSSDDSSSALMYYLDLGDGLGWRSADVSSVYTFNADYPRNAKAKAIDQEGKESEVAFTLFIQCQPLTRPDLIIDPSLVQITYKNAPNLFLFSAVNAVSGGSDETKIIYWDLNGDDRFDLSYPTGNEFTEFVALLEIRTVRLRAYDPVCNWTRESTLTYDFALPHSKNIFNSSLDEIAALPYNFIQGQVSQTAGAVDPAINAFAIVTEGKENAGYDQIVRCTVQRAQGTPDELVLSVNGLKYYNDNGKKMSNHGWELAVDQIKMVPLPESMGEFDGKLDFTNASMQKIVYHVQNSDDNLESLKFSAQNTCQVTAKANVMGTNVTPCLASVGATKMRFKGELAVQFSCTDLKEPGGKSADVTYGTTKCVFDIDGIDCNPGGGGGGGTKPPAK